MSQPERLHRTHGPWVDIHAHPGRCFLGGLEASSPFVQVLGAEESAASVASARRGEVAVVNASTVADLAVIGPSASGGLRAVRDFEPGEARSDHDRQLYALAGLTAEPTVGSVLCADDIVVAHDSGVPGVFVSCEGADFLDGSLGGLADAHQLGARSITLVHYRINELGDIQTEDETHGGLTDFGRDVVAEMNQLGMIIDLAHGTFATTTDVLEISSQPIMISHSHLASPGADHPRLLSEEHARVVASAGGLIGAWPSGVVAEDLGDYCDEICRLIDVVGVDHVAIGTDLDANYRPVLTRYEQFPELAARLGDRGLDVGDVDKVLGGNFIELFRTVAG